MNTQAYNKQYFKDLAHNALTTFPRVGLEDVLASLLEITFWEGHGNGWWVEKEGAWQGYEKMPEQEDESFEIHKAGAGDKDE